MELGSLFGWMCMGNSKTMTQASTSVMPTKDEVSLGEDGMASFQQGSPDGTATGIFGWTTDAITWKLRNEEGDLILEQGDKVSKDVGRLWIAMYQPENGTFA